MTTPSVTEGLPVGTKFTGLSRTVGEGDFAMLHNISWNTSASHCDKEYMKNSQFGERILLGSLLLAVMAGISSMPVRRVLDGYGISIIALIGYEDVRFTAPVLPGDTLTIEMEFIEARPTHKPDRYVLRMRDVAFKQDGQAVAEDTRVFLVERKT